VRLRKLPPAFRSEQEAQRAFHDAINLLVDAGGYSGAITVDSDQTVTSEFGFWFADATSAAITLTLPPANAHRGKSWTAKKVDSSVNAITIATAAGTIDGGASVTLSSQWDSVTVTSDGSRWLITARI
jgi:hypothetical protein